MSLWRKRGTSDTVATDVHHNEQKPDHLVNILNKLHDENVRLGLYEGVYDLSIKSEDLSIKSKKIEEDDDIQVYKKPWVGLTEDDIKLFDLGNYIYVVRIVEARLRELNA